MFVSTNFTFDGISGQDMYGLMIVRTDSGMLEQPFGISRKTVTERIKNRGKSFFYGFEDDVLTFKITLAKTTVWTYAEKIAVNKWLIQDHYCDFISSDSDLVYKCVVVDKPIFYNTGADYGYVEIQFECDSPYAYSPVSTSTFDLSDNTTTEIIILENKSNVLDVYKPEIQFTMVGSTSVKLENLTRGGEVMEFTDIANNEVIYCSCENERIYSALSDTRLQNLTDKRFLKLAYGENQIRVTGQVIIETRMIYPMMV